MRTFATLESSLDPEERAALAQHAENRRYEVENATATLLEELRAMSNLGQLDQNEARVFLSLLRKVGEPRPDDLERLGYRRRGNRDAPSLEI